MAKWDNDLEKDFLNVYRDESILWDTNHPSHKDRNKVHDAWERIGEWLNIPVADLKRKKDSLMATYRMHRRRIKASETSGSGANDVHKPVWFAYDLMNSFLGGRSLGKTDRKTASDASERTSTEIEQHADIDMDSNSIKNEEGTDSTRDQTAPVIRRRRNPLGFGEAGSSRNDASSALHKDLLQHGNEQQRQEDECVLYSKILVMKLGKLPYHERLRFMHEIDGLFINRFSGNKTISATPTVESKRIPGIDYCKQLSSSSTSSSESEDGRGATSPGPS